VIAAQARAPPWRGFGPRRPARWFDRAAGDRLLVVNLGGDLDLASAPEPRLAPPRDAPRQMTRSSDQPRTAPGALEPCGGGGWRLAASRPLFAPAQRP
jgi:hypothetical protein